MSSWSEFIHMGGYAFYVWTSYAIGVVVIVANIFMPLRARTQAVKTLQRRYRRERKQ